MPRRRNWRSMTAADFDTDPAAAVQLALFAADVMLARERGPDMFVIVAVDEVDETEPGTDGPAGAGLAAWRAKLAANRGDATPAPSQDPADESGQ